MKTEEKWTEIIGNLIGDRIHSNLTLKRKGGATLYATERYVNLIMAIRKHVMKNGGASGLATDLHEGLGFGSRGRVFVDLRNAGCSAYHAGSDLYSDVPGDGEGNDGPVVRLGVKVSLATRRSPTLSVIVALRFGGVGSGSDVVFGAEPGQVMYMTDGRSLLYSGNKADVAKAEEMEDEGARLFVGIARRSRERSRRYRFLDDMVDDIVKAGMHGTGTI